MEINFYSSLEEKELLLFKPFHLTENEASKHKFVSGQSNYLIIRNTGFGLSPREIDTKNEELSLRIQQAFIITIFSSLNISPVTYHGENDGKVFRRVTPMKSCQNTKSSYGSLEELGFHTDNNHLFLGNEEITKNSSCSPDYLSLFAIRNNESIPTYISDIEYAYRQLSSEDQGILCEPRFKISLPDSFSIKSNIQCPVVIENQYGFCSRFDAAFTEPLDDLASRAFNRLNEKLSEHAKAVILKSGDMLIFRNHKIAHSRKSFTPRYDGYDRLLIRVFGVDHLHRIKCVDVKNPFHATSI